MKTHIDEIKRAKTKASKLSSQPRFKGDSSSIFGSIYNWTRMATIEGPPYATNSKKRDAWLQKFFQQEPHLAGVLNSVVAIDKNRGWAMTGGRNQVKRYVQILVGADDGVGYRQFIAKQSQSYYTTDMGVVGECGRDGKNGPLRGLYHVDSARCRYTGKVDTPLAYTPPQGGEQQWRREDYFIAPSLSSADEAFHGLGFCAVSRCLELAKIMVAVYQHDQEQLLARAPKGLLLLQNITEDQWDTAMQMRDEKLDAKERKYFAGVSVLAQAGMDQIDAKLVALSQLPAGFDHKEFVDMLMYGYALAFGYDPSEFWPVQYGSLGRGRESEVQHAKATGKGGLDFALSYQEQLQMQFPESLLFEFDRRDIEGDLLEIEAKQAKADLVKTLYEAGSRGLIDSAETLISREEARKLLAEEAVIPFEWTEDIEDATATDLNPEPKTESIAGLKKALIDHDQVIRSATLFPSEPIVRYSWPDGRLLTLWERGEDMIARKSFPVAKVRDGQVLFDEDDVIITEEDVDDAVKEGGKRISPEYEELLTAEPLDRSIKDAGLVSTLMERLSRGAKR